MALFFYKEKNKDIRAAAYLRLSIEDGDKAESNSIGNQRELIRDFAAERPGLHLVEEYADDGYTGTNFERPGFKRMMEDIKSGKINCIIVKDLSRLGRNYIEMGKYLEQIFPMMGIRFIAINDNYDNANTESSDSDSIVVPFKNLLNDSYCRDISIKVRSQLDMKRRKWRVQTVARKSRKNLQQPEQAAASVLLPELEEAKIPAAIYGRLSVEDDEKEESMETQIALVQDYINRSRELSYVDTYFDNGFTGTNFKRPAFTRLMNDVRQKKIKCIVVKDLSRFGRNYLEAGYYIETVFPFLGIRLIAVTDNFDSTRTEDMESLALPIRNMVNAMYAKDISKKIWTSLQRKKKAGYAVGNDAPYGYIRNPVTKRNEIDPEAAFYVQLIFQWELMGVPIFEIARRMTLLQVPTPREWHRKMVEGKEVLTCKKWGVTTIRHILENQTYVGDTINNKSTQKLFAGQDRHDLPKEQWYVAKNTHPAIIARDDFEKVQKILKRNQKVFHTIRAKSEQIRAEYQNDLAGMVFCADCGRQMEFERLPHGAEESKKVCYYICKARQADDKCIGHQIPEKLLKALIMDQLHLFIVQLSDKRKVLEVLQEIEDVQNPVYRAKGEIMSLTDKVSQMAKKREQLYADYVAGVVDSEDYQLIREDYSRQYDGLRAALQEAESKKTEVERQIEEYLNMTSHLEEHLDNFEFDIQLVKSLVQKIEVSADKRIRIVFGFQDVFTELGKESAET